MLTRRREACAEGGLAAPAGRAGVVSRGAGVCQACKLLEEGLDVWSGDRPPLPCPAPPMSPSWTRPSARPCSAPAGLMTRLTQGLAR